MVQQRELEIQEVKKVILNLQRENSDLNEENLELKENS
jgi:hypothetical protein